MYYHMKEQLEFIEKTYPFLRIKQVIEKLDIIFSQKLRQNYKHIYQDLYILMEV